MVDVLDIPTAYSKAIVEAGRAFPNMFILDADLSDSCQTEEFHASFPERYIDLGVAEQSLPTFSAGLALMGKIPFYNTFAVFAVHRGFDMIRLSIAYNHTNVKIVGHAAGQSLGYAGPSHHTLEDIAPMRALPGMVVISPSDAEETRQMVFWMAEYEGPVYLRLQRSKVPPIHQPDYRFSPGKTELLREGEDLTLFVTGDLVLQALQLHNELAIDGISVQVVNVPCLKPLPPEEIIRHGRKTRAALTLEDHNIYGGLGSAVAEIYAEFLTGPLKRIGIPDTFTESDDRDVLLNAYGVSLKNLKQAALDVLAIKKVSGG